MLLKHNKVFLFLHFKFSDLVLNITDLPPEHFQELFLIYQICRKSKPSFLKRSRSEKSVLFRAVKLRARELIGQAFACSTTFFYDYIKKTNENRGRTAKSQQTFNNHTALLWGAVILLSSGNKSLTCS